MPNTIQKREQKNKPALLLSGSAADAIAVWWTADWSAAVYSLMLHTGLACILAACMIASTPSGSMDAIDARFSSEEPEEAQDALPEFGNGGIEMESPADNAGSLESMVTSATAVVAVMPESEVAVPSLPAVQLPVTDDAKSTFRSTGVKRTGKGSGNGSGNGQGGNGQGGPSRASFFGKNVQAESVAFVIDASRSMYGNRFYRARKELADSLSMLKPNQRFFVVFYTDQTFPLFYPNNTVELIPAEPATLQKVYTWMQGSQAQGGTQPQVAMTMSLKLRPDVIFFLSDGQIPPQTAGIVSRLNQGSVVHTISFGSNAGGAVMQQIAERNGGTYQFIPDSF